MSNIEIINHPEFNSLPIDRVSLIGCVDTTWYGDPSTIQSYPTPLFAIDKAPEEVDMDIGDRSITRIKALIPGPHADLIHGNWSGMVDLPRGVKYGEGSVYLGHGGSPSDATGWIFDKQYPFIPENNLGYVIDPADEEPIMNYSFRDRDYTLIYASRSRLESLERIKPIDLWLP